MNVKYLKDDDSAYSSSYTNHSNVSTPKIWDKLQITPNIQIKLNEHCDANNVTNEEDTLAFDTSMVLSSSSSSSSPLSSLTQNSTYSTVLLTKSPKFDFINNVSLRQHSKKSVAKIQIASEYESVRDMLKNIQREFLDYNFIICLYNSVKHLTTFDYSQWCWQNKRSCLH